MKKCPKCKADIQEEARFCLYCMTSFEEKQTIDTIKENNKRWPYIIAAVLAFAIIVLTIVLFVPKSDSSNKSNTSYHLSTGSDLNIHNNTTSSNQENDISTSKETSSASNDNQSQNIPESENNTTNIKPENTTSDNTSTNSGLQNNTPSNNINSNDTTSNSSSSNNTTDNDTATDDTVTDDTSTNNTSTSSTTSDDKAESDNSDSSSTTTSTLPEPTTITYIYRNAKYGDDFSVGANLDNSVVITGVKSLSSNGEYIIPDTIDGKKVVAIMGLAFCDESISSTVKTVIVPSTVKTIWNNAFSTCYNLTDIYFCGNSIYTESNAFPETSKRNGTLTIHCSANCSDRNYRYYKNSASYYDAEYEEWNG